MARKVYKENEIPADALPISRENAEVAGPGGSRVDALQTQWMRLNSLFQNHEAGMALCDDFGQLLLANQAFCRIFDKTPSEITAVRIQDLLPVKGFQASTAQAHLAEIIRKGPYVIGQRLRERRYLGLRQVVLSEDRDHHQVLVYVQELTESMRQQNRQAEREEMLLQVLEYSQEPFLLLDTSLTITAFNNVGAKILYGTSGKMAVMGASMLDYSRTEKQKEKAWRLFREVLSGLVVERELHYKEPGMAFHRIYKLMYRPFFDEEGKIYGIYVGGHDITNRRSDAKTIEAKEIFQEAMLRGSAEGVLILNQDLAIRYASPAVEKLLGRPTSEVVGQLAFDFVHPNDQRVLAKSLSAALADQQSPAQQLRILHPHLGIRHMRYELVNYLEIPSIAGLVLHFQDISEEQLATAESRFYQRLLVAKTDFGAEGVVAFDADGRMRDCALPDALLRNFPALGAITLSLHDYLQLLGKQPTSLLRKLQRQAEPLEFDSQLPPLQGPQLPLRLQLLKLPLLDETFRFVLLLASGANQEALDRLSQQNLHWQQAVSVLQDKEQQWRQFLATLDSAAPYTWWQYRPENATFEVLQATGQQAHLELYRRNRWRLRADGMHPADEAPWQRWASDRHEPAAPSIRLLAADGSYEPHWQWAQWLPESNCWQGLWLRLPASSPAEEGTDAALGDLIEHLQLAYLRFEGPQRRLVAANALAKSWFELEVRQQAAESLPTLQNSRLMKALLETAPGDELQQFDYFHAPTQTWYALWLQPVDQALLLLCRQA